MYVEAEIERVWRCTWRPKSWNSEMHLEAVIEWVLRCTWWPWSIEIGGVLGGGWSGGCRLGGRCDGSWHSIHWLTGNHGNVESWVQSGPLRDERLAACGRQSILGWCSARWMQYSVYAVLGVNLWSLHGEIDREDSTSCSEVMVELRTRKREVRRYEGNHDEKQGLRRVSCASQLTIPDTAGKSPDAACNYTDTRSSQPNQASRTRDFSYPLVYSISFSSSSPISLFLVHNSTIITEHQVKSSLSISPCLDHELTPSKAYTKHCIQWVLHHPKIVCLPFILRIAS